MSWLDIGLSLPITQYTIILAFALIGGGLKFIDSAFDEDIFNKKVAILLAPLLVVIWIRLSVADPTSAMVLFSILFSVLLTGKIDNFVFKTSALVLILFFVLTGTFGSLWIPLLILIAMGLLDEKGNDYVEENKTNKIAEFCFLHRFSMKLGILALCANSILPWLYLFAFLTFDIAYDSVGTIGQRLAAISSQKLSTIPSKGFRSVFGDSNIKLTTTIFFCSSLPQGLSKGHPCFMKGNLRLGSITLPISVD